MTPPQNPAGDYTANVAPTAAQRAASIAEIAALPAKLRALVEPLSPAQHETVYRNWTVRQIVHHLADSHANAFIRCKLAISQDSPTINAYDPGAWVAQPDAGLPASVSLSMLDALHARWACLLESLTDAEFARGYFHPEHKRVVPLREVVGLYAWHGRHHAAQIAWLRDRHG